MEFDEKIWSSIKDFTIQDVEEEEVEDLEDSNWCCPSCKSKDAVEEINEEMICRKCGTVLETLILQGPEFRWFGSEDRNPDPSRCSCPINPLLPESSLGTTVLVKANHSREMQKIKRYHLWNQTHHRERTLWNIFDSLQIRGTNAGVTPAVVEEILTLTVSPKPADLGATKNNTESKYVVVLILNVFPIIALAVLPAPIP